MVAYNGYSSTPTKPQGGKWNPFSLEGQLRGLKLEVGSWNWYNSDTWHPGFDTGGTTGSTSSEDDFSWHDGALNSKHKCHTAGGEITWWVRSPGGVGSKENPGLSCLHVLKANPKTNGRDGAYWLKLSSGVKRVYCEMTTHGGGWTAFLSATNGQNLNAWPSASEMGTNWITKYKPLSATSMQHQFKLSADDINGIRTSWETWGNRDGIQFIMQGEDKAYWTTSPGNGDGVWGAENFHRSDCKYEANRVSGVIRNTRCAEIKWAYDQTTWLSGGHWWDNSGSYASWNGHYNEGDHGTGSQCFTTGRGMGYHSGCSFHRGWCGGACNWGIEFVRG